MKIIITIILTTLTLTVFSQQTDSLYIPSNSFDKEYHKSNPTLTYSYDNNSQTHNYSNNWDFDKDGIKDELYFVGTSGAHLYYYLKVILSSDKKTREFNFVQLDFPILTATDTLDIEKTPIGFIVADLGQNLTTTIIVRLDDQSYFANKKILADKKIKTRNVVISFENGKTEYGSL
ncbi:hypothetical protein M0M57_00525 [Flavobacterium azooxidireducens]|uniref:Uncharacterized protein n=1 Tax=Flavobacterium azooxidireducens TaxID=1871076 RepID=A0ABY4KF64_9FLAO|nr:hypothetical protein [Flavobacterium azooxidireducens]UPQ79339.1 hypothetical protein M0M57_00525 [Flavobacterium azooxidireducens]